MSKKLEKVGAFPITFDRGTQEGSEIVSTYVGPAKVGKALLEVHVPAGMALRGFVVDEAKKIRAGDNEVPAQFHASRGQHIKRTVMLEEQRSIVAPKYPRNHLKLLVPLERGGFQIWEYGLVVQHARMFTVLQQTYQDICFRNKQGKVICPAFPYWEDLLSLLEEVFTGRPDVQSSVHYRPRRPEDANGIPDGQARVQWWNCVNGLGAALTHTHETAKIHWKDVHVKQRGTPRLIALQEGTMVRYQALTKPKPYGHRPSEFRLQARGVHPLEPESS